MPGNPGTAKTKAEIQREQQKEQQIRAARDQRAGAGEAAVPPGESRNDKLEAAQENVSAKTPSEASRERSPDR